jgi:hypothetical protein
LELSDLEPYQSIAGDSCADDIASGTSSAGVNTPTAAPTADPVQVAAAAVERARAQAAVDVAKAKLTALRADPEADEASISAAEQAVVAAKALLATLKQEHADQGLSPPAPEKKSNLAAIVAPICIVIVLGFIFIGVVLWKRGGNTRNHATFANPLNYAVPPTSIETGNAAFDMSEA